MNPDSYEEEDLPITLHVPARSGYNFAGWYLESNYRTKVTQLTEDTLGDVTLFAKWTRTIDDESSVQMYSYNTGSSISGTDRELKNCEYSFYSRSKFRECRQPERKTGSVTVFPTRTSVRRASV